MNSSKQEQFLLIFPSSESTKNSSFYYDITLKYPGSGAVLVCALLGAKIIMFFSLANYTAMMMMMMIFEWYPKTTHDFSSSRSISFLNCGRNQWLMIFESALVNYFCCFLDYIPSNANVQCGLLSSLILFLNIIHKVNNFRTQTLHSNKSAYERTNSKVHRWIHFRTTFSE